MSAVTAVAGSPYQERRRRTQTLIDRLPYAGELLQFYLRLLDIQERVHESASVSSWLPAVSNSADTSPRIDVRRLPFTELLPMFRDFLAQVAPVATSVLEVTAACLQDATDTETVRLLRDFVTGNDQSALAATLECELPQLEFFPRAFLQPVAEAAAARAGVPIGDWRQSHCPRCERPPQVAAIRDVAEAKGQRSLVCSFCASEWPFARSTCPSCGEQDPDKLIYHVADTADYIRIEECKACRRYIKSVDLREDGRAVPLVDDIAFMALDLWAHQQDLRRIHPNLLGL